MIICSARYLITQLFFVVMRLPVRQYRKEVERLWSLKEDARLKALDEMLSYYRPLNSDGEEVISLQNLKNSPSLSKRQLIAQSAAAPSEKITGTFSRHTAGTTGQPTHVSLSRDELARMLGVRDYCFRHHGLKLGQREARVWGRAESGVKSWAKNFVMNRRVFHPVGAAAEQEVSDMLSWRPDYIYGYASLLLEASKVLDRMNFAFKSPKCVVCTAESILPAQKAFIGRVFGAPVVEEYGSTEFDVIAFECIKGHRHLVNPWLVVEEAEENGLISDVSRVTQYLIRYELGDSFTLSDSGCTNLGSPRFLTQLQGRTIDLFFYFNKRDKVHIISIARLLDRYFSENGDVLSFKMEQNVYAVLDIEIDSTPLKGEKNFRSFLEFEIDRLTGLEAKIRLSVNRERKIDKKRNYFIQNMSAPE